MKKVNDYFSIKNYNLEKKELFEKFYHFGCHISELPKKSSYIKLNVFENDLITRYCAVWKQPFGSL